MSDGSMARRLARWAHHRGRAVLNGAARDGPDEPPPWVPAGHFYSPFPDLDDYERRLPGLLDRDRAIAGVDLREREQVALVDVIAGLVADIDFPEHRDGAATRYWFDNPAYGHGDGAVLHGMLRHLRPRRIVEVGSGYSSAMILDTVDGWLDDTEVTFVEPHPELLRGLLGPGDEGRVTIHEVAVQDVGFEVFDQLGPGDVLFIDSTHVVKAGSDVNHLVFEVLPRLAVGVWIHLHDMFFPFEYPEAWVREGRAWHETYLVRAFLAFNPAFEIRWFQDFLWARHREVLERLPQVARNPGGNLWIERVA
jgi:predicted O-methyltransferase YrrM